MANNFTELKSEIKAQIKPNGVGAITGQVLQDAMLDLVGVTESEMSALNAETDAKVTQLSQEWQEIKDANFNVVVEAIPHIEKIVVTDGGAILEPDKLYDFGEASQIVVGFAPATNAKYAAQYAFQFKSPASAPTSLTMPEGVVFPVESESMLQIKAGRTYQITIVENLAVATSWEV